MVLSIYIAIYVLVLSAHPLTKFIVIMMLIFGGGGKGGIIIAHVLCWLQLSLFVFVLRLKQALVGYLGNVLNLSRTLTPENVSLFVVCDIVVLYCMCVHQRHHWQNTSDTDHSSSSMSNKHHTILCNISNSHRLKSLFCIPMPCRIST